MLGHAQAAVTPKVEGEIAWYDATQWEPEGRGWDDTLRYYDRFPGKAQKTVRKSVWNLSRSSAGMVVRFATDAKQIDVRYRLHSKKVAMPHMPATGVSGVDLYVKHDGRWRWLGVTRPKSQNVKETLVKGLTSERREYMLYLPLYNGVDSLDIGVAKDASFEPLDPREKKPIVFYGTSIMQGACASRPGMAHASILGRRLDRPVVNLGFSGNGTMDLPVAQLMTELDAAMYVVDCLPNMNAEMVAKRTEPLVKLLRKARPETPIVLVEDRTYADAFLLEKINKDLVARRAAFKKAYQNLLKAGVRNLGYVEGEPLLGPDGEATVDHSHPSDLGMQRMADYLEPILRKILKE
jgi:lysophospholipase L1-like esterase